MKLDRSLLEDRECQATIGVDNLDTVFMVKPGEVLWQPSSSRSFQWAPLDDVVMGGASRSDIDNKSGLWKGLVTDANSGGFVGIRSVKDLKLDLTNCQGLEFTFQSSPIMPTRLKVVLRDSTDFNGIAWTSSVDVPKSGGNNIKNMQVRVKLPLNKNNSLVPTKFAQIINDDSVKEGINKSSITALQLVYSKFEYEGALNPKFVTSSSKEPSKMSPIRAAYSLSPIPLRVAGVQWV